jgi:hypothetical protein
MLGFSAFPPCAHMTRPYVLHVNIHSSGVLSLYSQLCIFFLLEFSLSSTSTRGDTCGMLTAISKRLQILHFVRHLLSDTSHDENLEKALLSR